MNLSTPSNLPAEDGDLNIADLFAGTGSTTLAGRMLQCLTNQPFASTQFANDNSKYACRTFRYHFPNAGLIEADIADINFVQGDFQILRVKEERMRLPVQLGLEFFIDPSAKALAKQKKADFRKKQRLRANAKDKWIFIGGVPCNEHSQAKIHGKDKNSVEAWLVEKVVHLTADCQPLLVIIENVKEYDPMVKKYIHQSFGSMGYNVQEFILNHSQFGGNTTRERLFIFCCKGFKVSFEHLGIFPQRKAIDSFLPGRKSVDDCYNITPPTMSKLLDYVHQVEQLGIGQFLSSEWWKSYYGRYTRLDTFSSDKGKGNFESYVTQRITRQIYFISIQIFSLFTFIE